MTREFQVLYRETENAGTAVQVPKGPVLAVNMVCDSAKAAASQFKQNGLHVVAVNFVRAIVDWSKPVFDREEAAAYLCNSAGTLSAKLGDNAMVWAKDGRLLFPRTWLDLHLKNCAEGNLKLLRAA